MKGSPLYGRYAQAVDRESAYERLTAEQQAAEAAALEAAAAQEAGKAAASQQGARAPKPEPSLAEQVVGSGIFTSLARSIGTQLGREISRSIFGTARRKR